MLGLLPNVCGGWLQSYLERGWLTAAPVLNATAAIEVTGAGPIFFHEPICCSSGAKADRPVGQASALWR
jgi:hypothetical protein